MNPPVRLLLVDDRPRFRHVLRDLFKTDPGLELVGEATNGRKAVTLAAEIVPDVILMDLKMEAEMDGVDAILQIRQRDPQSKILVLSNHDEERYIRRALEAGIQGYLIKDDTLNQDLLQAIHEIADGGVCFHAEVQKFAAEQLGKVRGRESLDRLTRMERKILAFIATEGLSNRAIGQRLKSRESTIKGHVSNILSKLRVKNRTQAVVVAREKGLL